MLKENVKSNVRGYEWTYLKTLSQSNVKIIQIFYLDGSSIMMINPPSMRYYFLLKMVSIVPIQTMRI